MLSQLACLLLAQGAGEAQPRESEDVIVVEGSRLGQAITEIGSSVSVITAQEIERLGFDFVADAIASAPGVTVNQNGAFGGASSVRIRGAASAQTLVLIDGVPVNDAAAPGGGFDFARLDTENIERIEILKGPQSTLWGTDAIGGVVSITTKAPEERLGGSAFVEGGSFGTARGGASLGNSAPLGDFRLAVTGFTTDGISKADEANGNDEADGLESLTLSGKGGLNLPAGARLAADILYTDAETAFDSFVFGVPGNVGDGDETTETEDLAANVSLTLPLLGGRLENLLLAGYASIDRQNFAAGTPSFGAEGERAIFRYQGTLDLAPAHTLAFGAEHEETEADGEEGAISGIFALYEWKPVDSLTLTGGVRADDHDVFGSETTARAAVAWNPTETLTLRASWGEGFKAPTIFQTTFFCCGAAAPNTDLSPETSEAFDFGLDWRAASGRASAGITYFDQDVRNQIDFSFALGGYENIAEVRSSGVEIYGDLSLTSWLTLSADYAYLDAEDGAGNTLVRLPEHSGEAVIGLDPEGPFSGAILLRYNGEEETVFGTTLDSWTRVDVTARYALGQRTELFGRIENLLDTEYQQILGYGTPGLSAMAGLRLRY